MRAQLSFGAAWVLGAALLVLALGGCDSGSTSDTSTNIVYAVVGDVCATDVIYQNLDQQLITLTAQTVPWNTTFDVPAKQVNGFPLSLTATNDCVTGTLTANIVVNGALFGSATTTSGISTVTVTVSLF